MPRQNNEYNTTLGKTPTGRNRAKPKGKHKPRGRPFPKKGEDPEFDKKRAEHNAQISHLGVERRQRLSKYKRKDYWEDQMEKYLEKDGNENAGVDILMEIDGIIQRTESDNTRKELLKLKVQMLGLTAPPTPVEKEEEKTDEESIDEIRARLAQMGLDVTGGPEEEPEDGPEEEDKPDEEA